MITKSGTNTFSGSMFGYYRDDAFMANSYFAKVAGQPKPPFTRTQYGGSIGGPLSKNKAFFFGAVEFQEERKTLFVPERNYEQLQLLVPLGADPSREVRQPMDELKLTMKVNAQLRQSLSAFARWGYADTSAVNDIYGVAGALPRDLSGQNETRVRPNSLVAGITQIISPRALNQITFQNAISHTDLVALSQLPVTQNLVFPSVQIGAPVNFDQYYKVHKLQVKDDFSWQLGGHSLKMGADFTASPTLGERLSVNSQGTLSFFDDPSTIVNNTNGRYPNGFQTPGIVARYTQANGFGNFSVPSAKQLSAYVQDDWKIGSSLTLNVGVRYDATPGYYGESLLDNNRTYQALKAIGSPYATAVPRTDWSNVAPRLGVAWDVSGDGRTVLRGGWGLYYDQTVMVQTYQATIQSKPTILATTTLVNTAIGTGQLAGYRLGIDPAPRPASAELSDLMPGGLTTGEWLDPTFRNPYSQQFNAGVSRQLDQNLVVSANYVRSLGRDEFSFININPIVGGTRVLASDLQRAFGDRNLFANVNIRGNLGQSRYDQLSLSVSGRAPRTTFQASYTLSGAYGYGGKVGSETSTAAPQLATDPRGPGEWGPAPVDERHRVVLFGVFDLPLGIQVSPIAQLASARPYTLLAGIDLNQDGNNNDRFVDPVTGQQAAVNSQRGDPFYGLDLRVTKFINIKGESRRLGLFGELFNVFNTTNFGNSYNGNGRSPLFKTATGFMPVVGNPFQAQWGARVTF